MPYKYESPEMSELIVHVTHDVPDVPGQYQSYSYSEGVALPTEVYSTNWQRSWENSSITPPPAKVKRKRSYRRILKQVPVYKGPRLPQKVYSKRLRKMVWARKPILIWKYVNERIYPGPSPKKKKFSYTKPNFLVYNSSTVTHSGLDGTYSYWADVNFYDGPHRYEGNYTGASWVGGNLQPVNGLAAVPSLLVWEGNDVLNTALGSLYSETISELEERSLTKFYEKAKSQNANVAQMLGERRQTASLLIEAFERLLKATLALKKAQLAKAARMLFPTTSKELANDWLLLQYGIKPLISDIEGLAKELTDDTPFAVDLISPARDKVVESDTRTLLSGFITDTYERTVDVVVKYKGTLTMRPEGWEVAKRLSDKLGLSNWASLLWELTPWSFVADWGYPLGSYLNNHDAILAQWDISETHKTVFIRSKTLLTRKFDASKFEVASYGAWPTTDGKVHCSQATDVSIVAERVYCWRQPTGWFLPELPLPSIKSPFSKGHALNIAALVTQLRK